MIAGVTFARCPTREIDAETEQFVLLAREGALVVDPLHGSAKLHAAVAFVAAYDAAHVNSQERVGV